MAQEGRRLSTLLDEAIADHRNYVQQLAEAERAYREARAAAWHHPQCPSGAIKGKDYVDGVTAELREVRDIHLGIARNAYAAISGRDRQINLLQSVAGAYREEAKFARTGPEFAA